MSRLDRTHVAQGMGVLLGSFTAPRDLKDTGILNLTIDAWYGTLTQRGVSQQEWHSAVSGYLAEGAGWPQGLKPFLDRIPRLKRVAVARETDWSSEAWGYVIGLAGSMFFREMNMLHARNEPFVLDPVLNACIHAGLTACGGYSRIGRSETRMIGVVEASFRRGFQSCANRFAASGDYPKPGALPPVSVARVALVQCAQHGTPTPPALADIAPASDPDRLLAHPR